MLCFMYDHTNIYISTITYSHMSSMNGKYVYGIYDGFMWEEFILKCLNKFFTFYFVSWLIKKMLVDV